MTRGERAKRREILFLERIYPLTILLNVGIPLRGILPLGKVELSGSNVLRFELADGTSIIVRPSGTEPKIKVYILTSGSAKTKYPS